MMIHAAQDLRKRADDLRSQGELDRAAALYAEVLAADPGDVQAERLLSSMTGKPSRLPSTPGGLKAAPFSLVRKFLPVEIHDALLAAILSRAADFEPAATIAGIRTDYRQSLILPLGFAHLDPALEQAFYERLLAHWPDARIQIRVPEFEFSLSETHVLIYRDAHFFAVHRDTGPNNTRRVTFAYNLHREPRRFRGGDLLLYDTYFHPGFGTPAPGDPRCAKTCTRIVPEDNRLVFFPSEFYHGVTAVSEIEDDVAGARIVINGWLHTTAEDGDVDRISLTPY